MTHSMKTSNMTATPTCHIQSSSPDRTREIAAHIGRLARPPLVITLTGDLGSGKTCFVQGLARGLQVPQNAYVTSPSYTLIHSYRGRSLLHHVDLYRLSGGDIEGIGLLDLLEDSAVIAIEWPERLGEDLPEDHLAVDIHLIGETSRRIQITAYGLGPAILLKELQNVI